jgi:predicted transcriptional regulator
MLEKIQERTDSKRSIYRTSELGKDFIIKYKELAELFSKTPPPPSLK